MSMLFDIGYADGLFACIGRLGTAVPKRLPAPDDAPGGSFVQAKGGRKTGRLS